MIVDMRTYTLKMGKVKAYFTMYEQEGYAIQRKYLGDPIGYFSTEIGNVNQVVHMWKYESLADRDQRRAALSADSGWMAYIQKASEFLITQENVILKSAPFSPI